MPTVLVCPECGAPLPPGRLICGACGASASVAARPEPEFADEDDVSAEELAAADTALAGLGDGAGDEPIERVERADAGPVEPPEARSAATLPPAPTPPAAPAALVEVGPSPDREPAAEGAARRPGGYLPPAAPSLRPYREQTPASRVPLAGAALPAAGPSASWTAASSVPAGPGEGASAYLASGALPAEADRPDQPATEVLRELGTFGLVAAGGSLALISLFLPWASDTGVVIGLLPAYRPEKWGWAAPVAVPLLLLTLAVVGLATVADRYEPRLGRAAPAVNRLHEVVLPLLLSGAYFGVGLVCVLQPFGFGAGVPVLLLASLFTFAGGALSILLPAKRVG